MTLKPRLVLLVLVFCLTAGAAARGGESRLYRDAWGVPHIWADDYVSAGYAIGQAQCEDSLSNVIYCLHAGSGRLSELMGEGMLNADLEARKLRHAYYARRDWPKLSRPMRELIQGFCDGINDYVAAHPEEIVIPFGKVTPIQVVAWHRSLLMLSAVQIAKADAEASKSDGYHPVYNPKSIGEPTRRSGNGHGGVPPGKSNSWAMSGRKTASGSPMLLIDPHWMAEGHLQLYEFWLHIPGKLEVGGFALTATPIPGLGVTPHAAWTVTAGGADSSDAYAIKINPDAPHEYRYDGKWEKMDVRKETIRVRQADGEMKDVIKEVLATRHGPVLKTKSGVPFAAAMGGYDRADAMDQYFNMAKAKSTSDFKRAIGMNRISYFNLMWATTEGDIGFVQTGQAPLRRNGLNWQKMVPGWTSKSKYRGVVEFSGLPTVENPRSGFLQNCNVAANVVTPGQKMKREDFPPGVLYGHYNQYRARGSRATQLLTELNNATFEDARRIAFDSYVPPADLWVPLILRAFESHESKLADAEKSSREFKRLLRAVEILGTWNRHASRDSVGATVFRFWRLACHDMKSAVGRDKFKISKTEAIRRDAIAALMEASADIERRYGKLEVPWGEIKRLRRGDQQWPLSGDGLGKLGMDTLRATAADSFNKKNLLIPRGGQCVTSVVVLGNPPVIRSVVAYGQSNKPNSRHYADQAPLFSQERFRPVPWTWQELEPQITSTRTFQVKAFD